MLLNIYKKIKIITKWENNATARKKFPSESIENKNHNKSLTICVRQHKDVSGTLFVNFNQNSSVDVI